jgi:hypothetical protein
MFSVENNFEVTEVISEAVGMLSGGSSRWSHADVSHPSSRAATIDVNNEQIGLGSAGYQIIIMQEVNCIVDAAE